MKRLIGLFLLPLCLCAQNNRPGVIVTQPGTITYPWDGFSLHVHPGEMLTTNVLSLTISATPFPPNVTTFNIQWYAVGTQPGTVNFGSPNSTQTVVTLSAPGQYNLAADANDGPRHAVSPMVIVTSGGGPPPVTNSPPTISSIPNQTIQENTSTGIIPFTVGDAETPAGSLIVAITSISNTNLIDVSGITLGGSGANRTIQLTPKNLHSGAAIIAVTVADTATPSLIATAIFQLTVNAVNFPPSFTSVPNPVQTAENTPIGFVVGVTDPDTPLANLVLNATTTNSFTSSLTVSGTGANRTVNVALVPNAYGTNTITLRLNDGLTTVTTQIGLIVTFVNHTPTVSGAGPITTTVGSPSSANFTIFDIEDGGNLTLGKASDNPGVLPTSAIVFSGSGTNRTVTVTPVGVGVANVTISATDSGGLTGSNTLVVTGTAVANTPPTISAIPPQSLNY